MIVWSLFTGIGGIDLGLDRAGMETALQVEINDYCQKVLEKHWPNTLKFRDIREFNDLISSVAGSPARMSALRESEQDSQAPEADCGLNSSARFAYYDPATSSWRTYQDCLALTEDETLGEYSETWPKAGMMRNGVCSTADGLDYDKIGPDCFLWATDVCFPTCIGGSDLSHHGGDYPCGSRLALKIRGLPTLNIWLKEAIQGFPLGWTDLNRSETP